MQRPPVHIFARVTSASTLLMIMTGAAVTNLHGQPDQAEFDSIHLIAPIVVFVLIAALAIALGRSSASTSATYPASSLTKYLGWIALALATAEGGLGHHATGPGTGTLHATLAAFLFAALAGVVLITSPTWQREPEQVQDYGWPSLASSAAHPRFWSRFKLGSAPASGTVPSECCRI